MNYTKGLNIVSCQLHHRKDFIPIKIVFQQNVRVVQKFSDGLVRGKFVVTILKDGCNMLTIMKTLPM